MCVCVRSVCVCVRVFVVVCFFCVCVCVCVRSFLAPRACRFQNIGTNGFTATQKKTFITVFLLKMLHSETKGVFTLHTQCAFNPV